MTTAAAQPVIRWRDVVTAEITKITTAPATLIMLAITVVANLLLAAIDASGVGFYAEPGQTEPASLSSFGAVMFAPVYAFLVLPVYAAASEHRGGQFRITLTAVPNRRTLFGGKVVAMLSVIIVAAALALIPARLIIGVSHGLGAGDILLDIGRWVAAYLLMSIIAFGLAGILRGSIAPLGILIAVPIVVGTGILQWPEGLRFLPDQASLSLLGTPGYDVTELPPAAAAIALTVWSLVSLSVYAVTLIRRDA